MPSKRLSAGCQDMLRKVMETDPEKRLTMDQIKNHEWYRTAHTPVHHC